MVSGHTSVVLTGQPAGGETHRANRALAKANLILHPPENSLLETRARFSIMHPDTGLLRQPHLICLRARACVCGNSLCGLLLHSWRESKPGEDDGGSGGRRQRSVRGQRHGLRTAGSPAAWLQCPVAIDTVLEPCRPRSRPACCRSPTVSHCPSPQR